MSLCELTQDFKIIQGALGGEFQKNFLTLGPLLPLIVLLLPQSLQVFSSDNLPALQATFHVNLLSQIVEWCPSNKPLANRNATYAFVQLPPVLVCAGVSSALVLGVHADLGWVLASQGPAQRENFMRISYSCSMLTKVQFSVAAIRYFHTVSLPQQKLLVARRQSC